MNKQYTVGLRFTADTTGLTSAITTADSSLQKLRTQVGLTGHGALGMGQALDGAGQQAQRFGIQATSAGGGADRLASAIGRVAHYGLAGLGLNAVAQAAMGVGQALFQASSRAQSLATQLNFATDGKSAQEMAFVTGVADRLGLQLSSTAQAYAGFAAAARGTALEGAPVRAVFESISKASAVMGLSAEQSSGALLAVQQMMGKGVVSAEEFRGQLGERMPIALQAGAQALGVTTAEFSKLLETGQIVAQDFLPKFAAAIDTMLAGSVEEAANRLDASAQRMGNAWEKLKKTVGDSGVSQTIGTGMTAASHDMNAFSEAMDRAKERGSGFFGQINQGLGVMIGRAVGLNYLSDAFRSNAERAAHLASALPKAETELAALQARGAATSENIYLRSSYFDALRYTEELRAAKRAQDALQGAAIGGGRGVVNPPNVGVQLEQQQTALLKKTDATQGAATAQKAQKALQSSYESFVVGLNQKLAAQQQELATGAKVSESDQLRIRLQELLGTSLKGLGAEQRKVLELGLQELAVGEKLAQQYKQASVLANARADARRQESQGIAQWLAEQEAAAQKSLADVRQRINALTMEEDAARLAASTNVSLAEAVELVAIARLQEAQAAKFHEGSEGWKAIEREIAARRELLGLVRGKETREGIKKTADEAEKELKRITEQYEQGLTNAAMQGGKSLREYVRGMLRTTAFRIVLDPVMKPLAGLLASMTGSGSTATSAASGGGIMGTANLLSSAYSALTTGVSSSITAGFAKLAGSSFGQSIGLSNAADIMGNNYSAFVPAGGQLTELGQSLSTGLGMLGNGLAGYGISSAISNGYTTGGNTVNVLSGIASAFFGPLAGVVGGLINRAFGRKLKDTGIEGTIGGSAGFEGNSYQFYKGGWLRSDKTVRGDLDASVDKSLDTAVKQMQLSMAGLATSIGAPTEAISSFSQAIKLSFNGLDEAAIQEKITQALSDYNEGLASAFIASVDRSELPKWVDRLMGNVDASAVERLQAIADYPAKLLQSFGTSRDQLAQLYAEGLASGDTAAAGQAVADSLVASIEASMLGNASAQVFDIVNQGIVTPLLDAIVLGQNVSEALSQASIQKTIARAKETAAAFAELWSNAEFTAALEDIRTTVGSALGQAGSAMEYIPRYTQAVSEAERASKSAADATEREVRILRLSGNEVAALAMERQRELASLDPTNRALQERIYALQDEETATRRAAEAAEAAAQARQKEIDALTRIAEQAVQILSNAIDVEREAAQSMHDAQIVMINAQRDAAITAFEANKAMLDAGISGARQLASALYAEADRIRGYADGMRMAPNPADPAGLMRDAQRKLALGDTSDAVLRYATDINPRNFRTWADYAVNFKQTQAQVSRLAGEASARASSESAQVSVLEARMKQAEQQHAGALEHYKSLEQTAQKALDLQNEYFDALLSTAQSQLEEALGTKLAVLSLNDALANQALAVGKLAYIMNNDITSVMPQAPELPTLQFQVPGFASGGLHSGGLRLVGENGPELEVTGPARYFDAGTTARMLGLSGGADNAEVVAVLRALLKRLDAIESNTYSGAVHSAKTARQLRRAMPAGDALAIRSVV